jgi:hypothetical protein
MDRIFDKCASELCCALEGLLGLYVVPFQCLLELGDPCLVGVYGAPLHEWHAVL